MFTFMKIDLRPEHLELYKYRDKVIKEISKDIMFVRKNLESEVTIKSVKIGVDVDSNITYDFSIFSPGLEASLLVDTGFPEVWVNDYRSPRRLTSRITPSIAGMRSRNTESIQSGPDYEKRYHSVDWLSKGKNDKFAVSRKGSKVISATLLYHMLENYENFIGSFPFNRKDSKVPKMREKLGEKLKKFRQNKDIDYVQDIISPKRPYLLEDLVGIELSSLYSVGRMLGENSFYLKTDESRDISYNIVYKDDKSIVVESIDNKADLDHRYYLIGVDDTPNKFFIHRLRQKNKIENIEKEDIREILGFDKHYDGDVKLDTKYRVQGDLTMIRQNYQDWRERLVDFISRSRTYSSSQAKLYYLKSDLDLESSLPHPTSLVTSSRLDIIDTPSEKDYESLKEFAGVDEKEIRKRFEYLSWLYENDWKRISQRRKFISLLDLIIEQNLQNKMDDYNKTEEKIRKESRKMWNSRKQVNLPADNHNIFLNNAIQDFFHHGYENPDYRNDEIRVIVHDESKMIIQHGEHDTIVENIPKGYYKFNFLDRHPLN